MGSIDTLTPEVQNLSTEVESLRDRVASMEKLQETHTSRIESAEKRLGTIEIRLGHVDHLLTSMQLDVRRLQRGLYAMRDEQTKQLNAMQDTITRIAEKLGA